MKNKCYSEDLKQNWTESELKVLNALILDNYTNEKISEVMGRSLTSVERKIDRFHLRGKNSPALKVKHDVSLPPLEFGRIPLEVINSGDWFRFGLVSDTHLCCREERLDALHAHYDLMSKEGIKTVFHAGNIADGFVPRINGASVFESSIDGQVQYVADRYPQRKNVTTYFISGNDHDGAWQGGKEGFNFGAYLQHVCELNGRKDLKYIGHVEADIELKAAKKSTIIRIAHPGGGCPYARSYVAQKVCESYEGNEKPAILILGHHHVSNYLNERNIHVINMPGFQSQTIFGRTKRLRFEIGGAILEFKVNPEDGAVTRCRVEFNLFFDRGYYRRYLKSDTKLISGHLVLK